MQKEVWIALTCFLLSFFGVVSAHHENDGEQHSNSVDEKYADLLQDPYSAKLLNLWLDPTAHHPIGNRDPEKIANLKWIHAQDGLAFPVLLEVLKRENNNFREGLPLKTHTLAYFLRNPGDKSAVVEEIRKQLPEWAGKNYSHDSHIGYVINSLEILSKEGEEQDKEIISSFIENGDGLIRERAERFLANLDKRLEREAIASLREEKASSRDNTSSNSTKDPGKSPESQDTKWPFIVAIAALLLSLGIWLKSRFFR